MSNMHVEFSTKSPPAGVRCTEVVVAVPAGLLSTHCFVWLREYSPVREMMIRQTIKAALPCSRGLYVGSRLMHATGEVQFVDTDAAKKIKSKHRVPQKRASKLLNELKNMEFEKLKNGREWPAIRAGDAIEVKRLDYASAEQADTIRGVVITKTNRASDSAVTLLNYEYGTPILRRIVLYGPLIRDVQVIQKAFIHKGLKRVRRSRLYYLQDRDPSEYTVKY